MLASIDHHIPHRAGGLDRLALVPAKPNHGYQLTDREIEMLIWVARGKSNRTIAMILGISAHTVDTYLRRVMQKFEVASRTTAAVRAAQYGLLPKI